MQGSQTTHSAVSRGGLRLLLVGFVWLAGITGLFGQRTTYKVRHLTIDDGLSQNLIRDMVQDQDGFLWFGTSDGLNRYDGYSFQIFRYDPHQPDGLIDNSIYCLELDSTGALWIGTVEGGLDRYDPKEERFQHFGYPRPRSASRQVIIVRAIVPESADRVWVGTSRGLFTLNPADSTWEAVPLRAAGSRQPEPTVFDLELSSDRILWIGTDAGLFRLNCVSGHSRRIPCSSAEAPGRSPVTVHCLFRDSRGILWVGTQTGLYSFRNERPVATSLRTLTWEGMEPAVLAMAEDERGRLWLGTGGNGLFRLTPSTGRIAHYRSWEKDRGEVSPTGIRTLLKDRDGLIWIGTQGNGVEYLNPTQPVAYYAAGSGDDSSLRNVSVRGICLSRDSVLWVGGYSGLDGFDRKTGRAVHYQWDKQNPDRFPSSNIYCITEDEQGFLWLGTEGQGMFRFDPRTEQVVTYAHDPDDPRSWRGMFVTAQYLDPNGDLWFGTDQGLVRLAKKNRERGIFDRYSPEKDGLPERAVSAMARDSWGNLWVGTESGGLGVYQPARGQFHLIRHDPADPVSLSDNRILCIYPSESGDLWIGTMGGLNRLRAADFNLQQPERTPFQHYGLQEGFPNDVIYGVLEDEEGFLWISTNAGICRFNPRTETILVLPLMLGLQSREYNRGSWHHGWNGELFFGGIRGLNSFFPRDLQLPDRPPLLGITRLSLMNRGKGTASDGESGATPLLAPNHRTTLHLNYQALALTVDFAVLSYLEPLANRYRYRVTGLIDAWQTVSPRKREISLTHLPPGTYTLEIQGANALGRWTTPGKRLRIRIDPPPWQSWWAILGYLLTGIGLIVGFIQWRTRQVRRHNQALEQEVAARTRELQARETRLHNQNLFLESILESLSYPFYVVDTRTYQLVMANSAAQEWSRTEANTCYALKNQDKPCGGEQCPLRNLDQFREHRVKREIIPNADGETRHIEIHSHPVFTEDGEVKQIIEYYLDITDRVQLELGLQRNLAARNRELTAQALKMSRTHEIVADTLKKLGQLKPGSGEDAQLLRSMESALKELLTQGSEWEEFETWFGEVHKDFYRRLRERVPDATSREMKICAFLKLNLNTKEIASLTNLSVKSIEVYRSRLRKRLGVPTGENLVQFIQNI
ncbi:MAG: hypothetical protein D6762_01890 [Candidatus Neomarinimicrobiota bacterium]|nr:MAG: hypothetical protein D6762_01890 [Candidatus Neomarinimicrobiota bacterium]